MLDRFSRDLRRIRLPEPIRRGAWGAVALAAFCLVGCRTDALFRTANRPRGAYTPFRNVGSHRTTPRAESLTGAGEREADLVEDVITARERYRQLLETLKQHYDQTGPARKVRFAQAELESFYNIQQFRFLFDAEVPPATLHAQDSIPEADALYERAVAQMKKGGHNVPFLYRRSCMLEALRLFKSMIDTYPTSDKIDDAAFYCGEIHKEYFKGQELIAVRWYERAFQWNPTTPHPARFQAAVLYDYRLHNRARALELYHDVIGHETRKITNIRFASRRIDELTGTPTGDRTVADYRKIRTPPEGHAEALKGPEGP